MYFYSETFTDTFSYSFLIPQANFETGYYERKISVAASKQHDWLKEMQNTVKQPDSIRL